MKVETMILRIWSLRALFVSRVDAHSIISQGPPLPKTAQSGELLDRVRAPAVCWIDLRSARIAQSNELAGPRVPGPVLLGRLASCAATYKTSCHFATRKLVNNAQVRASGQDIFSSLFFSLLLFSGLARFPNFY
jgi:hypothetical protein